MMCVKGAAKRPRKKIEISKRAVDGSITLYLALTLAVTLSLYTVLIPDQDEPDAETAALCDAVLPSLFALKELLTYAGS